MGWLNLNGIYIGKHSGTSWSSYWTQHLFNESDLALKFDSRSGNILTDSVSAETASIMVAELKSNGSVFCQGDKTRPAERLFDGNDHTIYFRFNQHTDVPGSGTQDIVQLGGVAIAVQRSVYVKFNNNSVRISMSDGTTTYEKVLVTTANTNVKPLAYVDVIITIDGTGKILVATCYDPLGNLLGSQGTQSLAAFVFNNDNNATVFSFKSIYAIPTNFKKFSGIKTIAQCKNNAYVTDLVIHYPSILGAMDISGNGNYLWVNGTILTTHVAYINFNSYALDYGWDNYQLYLEDYDATTVWNRYICRQPDGTRITYDMTVAGAGYTASRLVGERTAAYMYNIFPAKIRFTNDFFDRSNATIWNETCRAASDYDAGNVKDFHIDNLNQRTIQSWLNDGYRGRLFVHFNGNSIERWDRDYLTGIYLYTTDNKGDNHAKILQYTGDYIAEVLSGGIRTYDAENYVKLGILKANKPMLVFRIDDGYIDCYTHWRAFYNGNGIKPVVGLHADQVGGIIDGNDSMDYNEIRTLLSEGWFFGDHNNTDVDFSNAAYQATLETLLSGAKATIEAEGIPCNYYIGNRLSSYNVALQYLSHKVGYQCHMAWEYYGEGKIRGTNPVNINKYRFCAIDLDLSGDYDIDSLNPATQLAAIDAQLDLCVSGNRLAIAFHHNHTANLETNVQTVINSATAKGVNIVTIVEALANIVYQ